MSKLIRIPLATVIIIAASSAAGQATPPQAAAVPCQTPHYRDFDFWLGNWSVTARNGSVSSSRIESAFAGCVVVENYEAPGGFRGSSFNIYDATRKVWHQTWVSNQGALLILEGERQGDAMIMYGSTTGSDGKVTKHRITWTPGADGSVRQLWESTDSTGTWLTAFDGRYTKTTSPR